MSTETDEADDSAKPVESAYLKLPRKLQAFVDGIAACKSGAEAAKDAGCKSKTPQAWASRMKARADVHAAIEERKKEATELAGGSAARVLELVHETVDRCRQGAPVLDREGMQVFVETANGSLAAAYEFDAKSVLKGLELLGSYHALWKSSHEHTGKNGAPLAPPVINIGFANGGPGDTTPSAKGP